MTVTDEELALIAPILQRLVWADSATRKKIQDHGVNIIPTDFYSNTPSIHEINSWYEYNESRPPYLSDTLFYDAIMNEVLARLMRYSSEFDPDLEGDEQSAQRFFWKNSTFSYSDAMSYYCFIRELKPKSILEI